MLMKISETRVMSFAVNMLSFHKIRVTAVLVTATFVGLVNLKYVKSATILGIFPYNLKSHFIIYDSLMTELARRGHHVTVIAPFEKTNALPNYTNIDIKKCDQMSHDIYVLETAYKSHDPFYITKILFSIAKLDESTLQCPPVQQLLSFNSTFDIVISEMFCSDTMLAFSHHHKSLRVSFVPMSIYPWVADRVGNPYNPSYFTYQYSPIVVDKHGSTFYQRFMNTIIYLYTTYYFYTTNDQQEMVKRNHFHFDRPTLSELARNTNLFLSFSHFSFTFPVPIVPGVIEVGGLQIRPNALPLPKDIATFIDESEYGIIYFSFGSLLRTETMPRHKLDAFLHAFAQLPQRVLWKWGNETMAGKSDKIFISKWMPQRDILAHPKVKLFIAHGGALGLNEAVYEAVPVLGIPFYADQTLNLKTLQSHGAAEILEYPDISEETVITKLRLMLNDKKYYENMKRVSRIFKDRPMSPMDTAIYWIEYVMRHRGAAHLRSAATDLPLYQYLLLDVIAFIIFIVFSIMILLYKTVKFLYRRVYRAQSFENCHAKSRKKNK